MTILGIAQVDRGPAVVGEGIAPSAIAIAAAYGAEGPKIYGTSDTDETISIGGKVFVINESGRSFSPGVRLRATSRSGGWIEGVSTGYDGHLRVLNMSADIYSGSGNRYDWNINVAGEPGLKGDKGDQGDIGPSGGPIGPQGIPGANSGNLYHFSTSLTGDPSAGKFLFNNANLGLATTISISEVDGVGAAVSAMLLAMDDGASVRKSVVSFMNRSGSSGIVGYITGTLTDNGPYDTYPWTPVAAWGTRINGDEMYLSWAPVGDKGIQGIQGPVGPQGIIEEAPMDGETHGRNSGGWVQVGATSATLTPFDPVGGLSSTNVQDALAELDAEKVAKAGDVMTGPLSVVSPPAQPEHAASKGYVDAAVNAKSSTIVSLTPPPNPTDGTIWFESDTGLSFIRFNDGNSSQWVIMDPQPDTSQFVNRSGDSMTGPLTVPTPTLGGHAVNVSYLSANAVPKTGGTITGGLAITGVLANDFGLELAPAGAGKWAALRLNGASAGAGMSIQSSKGTVPRWTINLGDGAAETGGNVGSDFNVSAFSDTGAFIGAPIAFNRKTLAVSVGGSTTVNGNITANFDITAKRNMGVTGTLNVTGHATFGTLMTTAPAGLIASSYLYAATVSSDTILYWCDEVGAAKGNITWRRASNNLSIAVGAQEILIRGGYGGVNVGQGMMCRNGNSGAIGANTFNTMWNVGTLRVWIDDYSWGDMAVTSDYRVKKDVEPLPEMWETVKALKPIKYTHKDFGSLRDEKGEKSATPLIASDDIERWGFIAHELQETLVPSAATGTKDEENCVQSPNWATIVSALTKALQEAMARIEVLEDVASRIEALELALRVRTNRPEPVRK